jgi:hypothetical protein
VAESVWAKVCEVKSVCISEVDQDRWSFEVEKTKVKAQFFLRLNLGHVVFVSHVSENVVESVVKSLRNSIDKISP